VTIAWEAVGASAVGRRRRGNEDSYRVDAPRGIFRVADGMGGHAAGEVASDLAASTVSETLAEAVDAGAGGDALLAIMRESFHAAHEAIVHCCSDDASTRGMGTTLTVAVVDPAGVLHAGHIGDSRLYLLRGGALEQLTADHTWVQREADAGRLAPEAAHDHPLSHILTRVLSEDVDPEPDLLSVPLAPGDVLLLCSDGLYNMLSDQAIARLLSSDSSLPAVAETLVGAANRAGGVDNVTVIAVRVVGG
jgi:protein phosphatase